MKIGLLSDTHSFFDEKIFTHFAKCDEIWHAGDFGDYKVVEQLKKMNKPLRGVYGNIDNRDISAEFPEQILFNIDNVTVLIRHIGGYPPRYNKIAKEQLLLHKPNIFVTGHSHILKIMFDQSLQCLYINPGAAGRHGWQKVRTIVRFDINNSDIKNCEIIELGGQ